MDQGHSNIDPDLLRRLEAAVARMPRKQREIFLAKRLDDMSYLEISTISGLTEWQVERQMAKALVHLMKNLDPDRPCRRLRLLGRIQRTRTMFFGGK